MANLLVLAVHLPGDDRGICGGFVLLSDAEDECVVAFRTDWETLVGEDDSEVLNGMEQTLRQMAASTSCQTFVAQVEDRLSNVIRSIERVRIPSRLPLPNHARVLRIALLGESEQRSN
jgi:hypothetical protein